MGLGETLMKLVVKVGDAWAVARRVREPPTPAMNELVRHVRNVLAETIERVMHAASSGASPRVGGPENKRNGTTSAPFA